MTFPPYWREAQKHLTQADPTMRGIIEAYQGEVALQSRGDAFETLCRSVIGQQISVKAADSVWAKFSVLVENVTPQQVLHKTEEDIRSCGLSGAKVKYIHAIATAFDNKTIHPQSWHNWDDEAVLAELIKLPGIGRWTAEMFLIFHMLRPDVLPVADVGLQKACIKHYGVATPKEITQHGERWRPFRSVATWYLWRSLDPVPVAY